MHRSWNLKGFDYLILLSSELELGKFQNLITAKFEAISFAGITTQVEYTVLCIYKQVFHTIIIGRLVTTILWYVFSWKSPYIVTLQVFRHIYIETAS